MLFHVARGACRRCIMCLSSWWHVAGPSLRWHVVGPSSDASGDAPSLLSLLVHTPSVFSLAPLPRLHSPFSYANLGFESLCVLGLFAVVRHQVTEAQWSGVD